LKNGGNTKYYWVRKGLKKFFDVHLDALVLGNKHGKNDHTATFR
jgi:hypothetical protein